MIRLLAFLAAVFLWGSAWAADPLAAVVPGHTTTAEVRALLGAPERVVQFDDCGDAMPDEALETWEYPGAGARIHVEFDDRGTVHLIARVPDDSRAPTTAKTAPSEGMKDMTM